MVHLLKFLNYVRLVDVRSDHHENPMLRLPYDENLYDDFIRSFSIIIKPNCI